MKRTLNIALLGKGFLWSGGAEFLRNLANALLSVQNEQQIKLFLLLPVRNKIDSYAELRSVLLKTASTLIRNGKFSLPRKEPAFDASFPDYFRECRW